MKETIEQQTFDEERALYHLQDATVKNCAFSGPADGESALKEARNILVENCRFSLRYPLWHAKDFCMINSTMDEGVRAAIWYAQGVQLEHCTGNGIKCLRECQNIRLSSSTFYSPEFGWKCRGIFLDDCRITSEYLFFESSNMECSRLQMTGKYSFQYTENVCIRHSQLETKDAFWHSKNVTVEDSTVSGEYLGWYSEGLTLIRCKITGTQPLCYCKNCTLIDCTMENTDLAFEYSEVNAQILGSILSVKNPLSGIITADAIGEIITEDSILETSCKIRLHPHEAGNRVAGKD